MITFSAIYDNVLWFPRKPNRPASLDLIQADPSAKLSAIFRPRHCPAAAERTAIILLIRKSGSYQARRSPAEHHGARLL
jgi:hypothetical protein